MKHGEYWKKRFSAMESEQYQKDEVIAQDIKRQFQLASDNIQGDIEKWYYRLAENNDITYTEAKKLLKADELEEFHWSIEEYIKKGEENAVNQKWIKELENASAKVHINRLQAINLQIQQEAEILHAKYNNSLAKHLKNSYIERFSHTAYEIARGTGVGYNLTRIDSRKIEQILKKPWAQDGANFSDRIWNNKEKLINTLHTELAQHVIRGTDPYNAVQAISKKMDVNKNRASTLVYTESAAIAAAAQKECFKELDVEKFEIVATLDSLTSEICREMDGKHFPMKEYEVGITAPPFHPNCRSVTCPYFEDDYGVPGKRAARGEDGKTYYVPADMTYKEWQQSFAAGGDKSGLQKTEADDTMRIEVAKLETAMSQENYNEYMNILSSHSNIGIKKLYKKYGNAPKKITINSAGGHYKPSTKELVFDYPKTEQIKNGRNKYCVLAHEYGHCFDYNAGFNNLHYSEIDYLNSKCKVNNGNADIFERQPSSSDEFLSALRRDKEQLLKKYSENQQNILKTAASAGVQDTAKGLFGKKRISARWGHKESYYDRKYNMTKQLDLKDKLKNAYLDLGISARNQKAVQRECRIYETASETWANIISAITCGGYELEYIKKYLPYSFDMLIKILKEVK